MFGTIFNDIQPDRSRVLSTPALFFHVQKQKRRLTIVPRPSPLPSLLLADSYEEEDSDDVIFKHQLTAAAAATLFCAQTKFMQSAA
jgi:hypothetical protein